jgi:alkylated DNA repair dioxygenase AlkB
MQSYFEYYPRFFPDLYPDVLKDVRDKCQRYDWERNGKIYTSNRASCIFTDRKERSFYGDSIKSYPWNESAILQQIREKIASKFDLKFDYVLVHIYEDGRDNINYHFDREALNSNIASVSFGVARKFRFRKIGQNKGYEKEFRLCSGPHIIIKSPEQRRNSFS